MQVLACIILACYHAARGDRLDDTKERILAAALDLFSAKGFAAVRTKAIAERAAVNEVTIFRLFGSKRNLYSEVFNRFSISPREALILAEIRGDLREDVRSIAMAIAGLVLRNGKIVRMSLKDMESFPDITAELRRQPEMLVSIVSDFFRRAAEDTPLNGSPGRLARVFVTSILGAAVHLQRFSDEAEVYEFVDDFVRALSDGLFADR